jgi:hypothetical protein
MFDPVKAYLSQSGNYVLTSCELQKIGPTESLCLVFRGSKNDLGEFDAFTFNLLNE